MIRLRRLRLIKARRELVKPFRSAESTQQIKETYLVGLESRDGLTGWSEVAAQNDPSYWPETVQGCVDVLERYLLPLLPCSLTDPEQVSIALGAVKGNQMARASLEMAAFDLVARSQGIGLWELLGGLESREKITAGVTLSLGDDPEGITAEFAEYQREGYRYFKAKVSPATIESARQLLRCGADAANLVLDANTSYAHTPPDQYRALDQLGVALIEQPLADRDFAGHARLAKTATTPIALDESIGCIDDVRTALALDTRPVINLKSARVGGYLESLKILDLCQREGLAVRIGGMLETGIGRAHNLALASHPGVTLVGDLAASSRYFVEDITQPLLLNADGTISRPTGPGIGRDPDGAWLEEANEIQLRLTSSAG